VSEGLVSVRKLRRTAPVQVVLVHGLFSNGAFWLPWLEQFGQFQVTLVGIDYAALLASGATLGELAARVDALVDDKPAHLVAHSFGCWPGAASRRAYLSRAFICPTFAATGFDAPGFCAEVAQRVGATAPEDRAGIVKLVELAIGYKARYLDELRFQASDAFHLPSDDAYFRYVERMEQGVTHPCRGGHFDASQAVAAIASKLMK
jgi:pimeloyl-ACP methyl ester carboxylesterase